MEEELFYQKAPLNNRYGENETNPKRAFTDNYNHNNRVYRGR